MTQNNYLNNVVLKKEWGFDGILMSDWGATHDGIAAANAGLDLEMPTAAFMNKHALMPAIQSGQVPLAVIDDKVRRILRKAIQFGFYDREQTDSAVPAYSQEGREVTLEEARSGMVLLKNERHLLPLDKNKIKTIAVLGPDAYPAVIGGGGSSLTKPFNSISYLEGISNYLGRNARVLSSMETAPLDAIVNQTEFLVAPGGPRGLRGEYFNNDELHGEPAPILARWIIFQCVGPVILFPARTTTISSMSLRTMACDSSSTMSASLTIGSGTARHWTPIPRTWSPASRTKYVLNISKTWELQRRDSVLLPPRRH
jgi:beta-glucosidase